MSLSFVPWPCQFDGLYIRYALGKDELLLIGQNKI